MTCSPPPDQTTKTIIRGCITRSRWDLDFRIGHDENTVLLDHLSHFWLSLDWQPDQGRRIAVLRLRSQTSSGGQVRFDGPDGPDSRSFSEDQQQLVAIYGLQTSNQKEDIDNDDVFRKEHFHQDVCLELVVDEQVRHCVKLRVVNPPRLDVAAAIDQLQAEVAIAAQAAQPADPNQRAIWDRYDRIFTHARAFATALPSLPEAEIPTVAGRPDHRGFDLDEIKAHLSSPRQPDSLAATKAQGRTDAFDPFRGHWRGDWRQPGDCGPLVSTCQDHQWGDTLPLDSQPQLYGQRVRLGSDSRPYRQGAAACTALTDSVRDITQPAINVINIDTGIIVGAVGLRSDPDGDIVAQRPHVGFYVAPGRLLWVAEEGIRQRRNDAEDGHAADCDDDDCRWIYTYSVFYEIREGDPEQPLYTIQGFDFQWSPQEPPETIDRDPINTKAGQYLQIRTDAERQLEQQFCDRTLQIEHLQQPYYRRQLERLSSDEVEAFLTNAAADSAVQVYLERLQAFISQQAALADAPNAPRPSITFIMGQEPEEADNQFYNAAHRFFDVNPAGTLVDQLRTLKQVRDHLASHAPDDGPWGDINIVVHANEEGGLSIPVTSGGAAATPTLLQEAIDDGAFPPLGNSVIDVRTTLRIRGCALGQSQLMLTRLSAAFGGNDSQRPVVRAPQHIQAYTWTSRGGTLTEVEESLVEFWFVSWPGGRSRRPSNSALIRQFEDKYPGVEISWGTALGRSAVFDQATRSRTFTYEFGYTYFTDNPPSIGSTQAARLSWLRAESNLEADLDKLDRQADDYDWHIDVSTETINRDQQEVTLTAEGTRTILRLERTLQASLSNRVSLQGNLQDSDFNRRTPTDSLRSALARAGYPLSDAAYSLVREPQRRWLILDPAQRLLYQPDQIRTFQIHKDGNAFQVRLEQAPGDGPVVHAHPPATDLRHFGEYIPARPATEPLGENVPVPP